jgi:hypothetical protein
LSERRCCGAPRSLARRKALQSPGPNGCDQLE